MPARPTILVFTKPPQIGLSKTRLAKDLKSPVTARRLAVLGLAKTLKAVQSRSLSARLYLTNKTARLGGFGALTRNLPVFYQGVGDLTDRLNKGLAEAPTGPVIFVGTDAPDISPALIRKAVRALQTHDAIFGPAQDGGFWLFGLNTSSRTKSPFHTVRWSSEHALADVKSNLGPKTRIATLPPLIDIDTAADVRAWRSGGAVGNSASGLASVSTGKTKAKSEKKPGFFARLFGRKAA